MARIYRGRNHLRSSARRQLAGGILCTIPLAAYFYQGFMNGVFWEGLYHFAPLLLCGVPASFFFARYSRYQAGLAGEKRCLQAAKRLPDSYYVFTNVSLFFENRRTEIDLVIIGETGVFIIEVKNHTGTIKGDLSKEYWIQSKKGRNGKEYRQELFSPIKQVKRQAYILAQAIRGQGAGVWVESAVLFANPAVSVEASQGPVPVLSSVKRLCPFVIENEHTSPLEKEAVKRIATIVRELQKIG